MPNNPHIFEVPNTGKKVNLAKLFELLENDYPDKLDKIDDMAERIEFIIRDLAWTANHDSNIDHLRSNIFTLFRLKDIFASMEIETTKN